MKKKVYYFTPVLGIAFCILLYTLLSKKTAGRLGETVIQALIALAIYYIIAFAVAYICMPTEMKQQDKKAFPFAFLPAKSDNNLLFALIKFVGVIASPDYVISSFVETSLDGKGVRRFNRRKMYFNLLVSVVVVSIAYLLALIKLYYIAKVFIIMVLIRIISRGVQIAVNCFTFTFDKEYRSEFKSTFMPEYAVTTLIELFFLFLFIFFMFTGRITAALYCSVRIFTLFPEFIQGLKMKCQFLIIIESALSLMLVITSTANYILMSREEKDK